MLMDHHNGGDGSDERGCGMRRYKSCNARTVAPVLLLALLAQSFCNCMGNKENWDTQPEILVDEEAETMADSTKFPRILTVLTTYNGRTPFIKSYREAAADEADGFEPFNKDILQGYGLTEAVVLRIFIPAWYRSSFTDLPTLQPCEVPSQGLKLRHGLKIFVTSDEEDADEEGVLDYKFGEPQRHRLLAAIAEASSRYEGQFDWIAAGDDDTVFLYRRAMALLRNIDHSQPVAIASPQGFCREDGRGGRCDCFAPEQKHNVSDMRAVKGCCLDFTRPCEVPVRPEVGMNDSALAEFLRSGVYAYQTDFYWPYGGTGFFLSAGLIETVQGSGDGWDLCREMFDEENTDVQVARCLVAHGLTISSFRPGFYTPVTADPDELREYLASNCQVIGVHAGIRHLEDHGQYTLDKFKSAISAMWDEDNKQPWLTDGYLATGCPQTWAALRTWK